MLERIKLEESYIGNVMVVTYDSYNPLSHTTEDFETIIYSPSFGRKVFYSKEEDEAIIQHDRACRLLLRKIIT